MVGRGKAKHIFLREHMPNHHHRLFTLDRTDVTTAMRQSASLVNNVLFSTTELTSVMLCICENGKVTGRLKLG